jgi:Rps23 Pro-64 3,4-dihydroxylase Tpa1-like proline 4-hydroxylase
MAHGYAIDVMSLLNHKIMVDQSLEQMAAKYKSAEPFPHIVIDNMFEDRLLDQLVGEMPSLTAEKFLYYEDGHLTQYGLRSAVELGETGFQLIAFLHSAAFLYFLSEITGIRELLPDPYLQGGGYHVMPPGGKFDVHADRNMAYETGLTRRLSLITYLNKSWKHEYGGQFELWNHDGSRREAAVEPLFNRTVIFEIADQNFHGVPSPIACPGGRCRSSFVVYYHTAQGLNSVPHSSVFPSSLRKSSNPLGDKRTVLRIARAFCPPIVARAAKKILRRK